METQPVNRIREFTAEDRQKAVENRKKSMAPLTELNQLSKKKASLEKKIQDYTEQLVLVNNSIQNTLSQMGLDLRGNLSYPTRQPLVAEKKPTNKQRIIDLLSRRPDGMRTNDIAICLGLATSNVSTILNLNLMSFEKRGENWFNR